MYGIMMIISLVFSIGITVCGSLTDFALLVPVRAAMLLSAAIGAVLIFRLCIRLKDKDALFSGALGLGTLAVSQLYFMLQTLIYGDINPVTVSDYSLLCSYFFFLSAVLLLVLPPFKLERIIRIGINIVSAICAVLITVAVLINNRLFLNITFMALLIIGGILSLYLYLQSKKIKQLNSAMHFSLAVLILSGLELVNRIVMLINTEGDVSVIIFSLFAPCFIYIAYGFSRLRSEETVSADGSLS